MNVSCQTFENILNFEKILNVKTDSKYQYYCTRFKKEAQPDTIQHEKPSAMIFGVSKQKELHSSVFFKIWLIRLWCNNYRLQKLQ